MQLTRAVQCDLTWTEDRAPVRTDPSAAPGAETEGRADAFNSTARPSLRDRHLCDKPSRPEAATPAACSRTVFPYALPTRFQFTLNQDISARVPKLRRRYPADRVHHGAGAGREASTKPPRGRTRRDSAPTVRKTSLQVVSPAFLERLLGPGRPRPQLTSRSSAGNRLRTCHWPGYSYGHHGVDVTVGVRADDTDVTHWPLQTATDLYG